jgi:putative FmdB family regulatory protein
MPLYEFQCESCQKVTERIQKYSDPPMETCPACGGPVKKLFSSPAIQFKGSGFYINDYARKSSNGGKRASGGDSAEKSEKTDTGGTSEKSESKSESTASAPPKSDS